MADHRRQYSNYSDEYPLEEIPNDNEIELCTGLVARSAAGGCPEWALKDIIDPECTAGPLEPAFMLS